MVLPISFTLSSGLVTRTSFRVGIEVEVRVGWGVAVHSSYSEFLRDSGPRFETIPDSLCISLLCLATSSLSAHTTDSCVVQNSHPGSAILSPKGLIELVLFLHGVRASIPVLTTSTPVWAILPHAASEFSYPPYPILSPSIRSEIEGREFNFRIDSTFSNPPGD